MAVSELDQGAPRWDVCSRQFGEDLVEATPKLLSHARWLTRNAAEAEDLLQDTLVRAWRFRDRFQPGTSFVAWLKCILRNQHLATLRRRRLEEAWFADEPDADGACAPQQPGRMLLSQVRDALGHLEPEQATAIVLIGVQGHSYRHAADALGLKCGTFKSHLNRARKRLQQELGSTVRSAAPPLAVAQETAAGAGAEVSLAGG